VRGRASGGSASEFESESETEAESETETEIDFATGIDAATGSARSGAELARLSPPRQPSTSANRGARPLLRIDPPVALPAVGEQPALRWQDHQLVRWRLCRTGWPGRWRSILRPPVEVLGAGVRVDPVARLFPVLVVAPAVVDHVGITLRGVEMTRAS